MQKSKLSHRQKKFVAAMLTARTVGEAAEAAGVSRVTGQKYLTDPAVKQAIGQGLDVSLSQAAAQVVEAMPEALATLQEIHQDTEAPPTARVSAARAILDLGPKLREALDLADRVAELEQRLTGGNNQ